jgi:hypothetical protein
MQTLIDEVLEMNKKEIQKIKNSLTSKYNRENCAKEVLKELNVH